MFKRLLSGIFVGMFFMLCSCIPVSESGTSVAPNSTAVIQNIAEGSSLNTNNLLQSEPPNIARTPPESMRFENALEAAEFIQNYEGDVDALVQPQGSGSRFIFGYDLYVQNLDIGTYESVAEIYADEQKIPLTYIEKKPIDMSGWEGRFHAADNYSGWFVLKEPMNDEDSNYFPYVDVSEADVDFSTHYLAVSYNRELEQLSIYPGKFGHPVEGWIPYRFGPSADEVRFPAASGWPTPPQGTPDDYRFPADCARGILAREYYPNTVFIYTIPRDINFNIYRTPGYVFWEYTQVEI